MAYDDALPECRCPRCGWEGLWDDVVCTITYHPNTIQPGKYSYDCPLCGTELESLLLHSYTYNGGTLR